MKSIKDHSRDFWSELYRSIYAESDRSMSAAELRQGLESLERLFRLRRHLAAVEMPEDIRNLQVLEIGSGAGAHSALFAMRGATVTAIDMSPDRAAATAAKLRKIGSGVALQADAESLPFPDEAFDIVYSNGVLHHTPDTERAVGEIHRVLRSGGRLVMMLYAKPSMYYLLLWLQSRLAGRTIGEITEWMGEKPQTRFNPVTTAYSRSEMRRLLRGFQQVRLRKNSFQWSHLPKIGGMLESAARRNVPEEPGGVLVYGRAWKPESKIELELGRWAGFAWNVAAWKP